MIITAMAATTETESEGIHFTTEALYQLAKTAISNLSQILSILKMLLVLFCLLRLLMNRW